MSCGPDVLRSVPLFALLDDEETAVLAAQVEVKNFGARERIYKKGGAGGQAYVMLSGKVRVSNTGDVSLPLVGSMHVVGLNTDAMQALLAKKLMDGQFVKAPQVSVFMAEYATAGVSARTGQAAHSGYAGRDGVGRHLASRQTGDRVRAQLWRR